MYRKIIVDLSEGIYTGVIQVHKPFHWVTIKTMSSEDRDYLELCMDEILEILNNEI